MKVIIYKYSALLLVFLALMGCQEEEPTLAALVVPTNLSISTEVEDDQSGNVSLTATADNALSIQVIFKQNAEPVVVSPGEPAAFRYTQSGQYSQLITVVAYGAGGTATSKNIDIDLDVKLLIDPEILQKIAGDGSKRWVWNKEELGHWGADAAFNAQNDGYQAPPNTLNPCAYDDVLTFSYEGDNYGYQLDTGAGNETLVGWADVQYFFPSASPQQFVDECRDISTTASTAVKKIATDTSFLITTGDDGELYLEVENSTLSFWSGATKFKIIELTDDFLYVRGDFQPILEGIEIAYYHQFRPENYDPNAGGGEETGSEYTNLVWEDDFNTPGVPNPANWTYDLGDGGWGNNEAQTYTNNASNVKVEDGLLKITAKKEGSSYTSARLKSENLREFTYGRFEVRAKLPATGGTWPAIWMLGANFDTVGWPTCGEIDIMEHVGNNVGEVSSAIHNPSSFGNTVNKGVTEIPDSTTEFHVYALEWSEEKMDFYVDDTLFYTYNPATKNSQTWPFDKDQFMILNVAVGGTLGGAIDPNFTEDSMEIDYVKVFQ